MCQVRPEIDEYEKPLNNVRDYDGVLNAAWDASFGAMYAIFIEMENEISLGRLKEAICAKLHTPYQEFGCK